MKRSARLTLGNSALAAACLALASAAGAATAESSLSILATVVATCTAGSGSAADGSGATLAVNCSPGASYVVSVDGGASFDRPARQASARQAVSGRGTGAEETIPVYVTTTRSPAAAKEPVVTTLIY